MPHKKMYSVNVIRKLAVEPRKTRPESFGIKIKFTEDLSLLE